VVRGAKRRMSESVSLLPEVRLSLWNEILISDCV